MINLAGANIMDFEKLWTCKVMGLGVGLVLRLGLGSGLGSGLVLRLALRLPLGFRV